MRVKSRLGILLLPIFLMSCGEDSKTARTRERQSVEIERLHKEMTVIDLKLKAMPADATWELNQLKAKSRPQDEQLEELSLEIGQLEARKASLKSDFDSYKSRYPLP